MKSADRLSEDRDEAQASDESSVATAIRLRLPEGLLDQDPASVGEFIEIPNQNFHRDGNYYSFLLLRLGRRYSGSSGAGHDCYIIWLACCRLRADIEALTGA
jgi:hypothetical protein